MESALDMYVGSTQVHLIGDEESPVARRMPAHDREGREIVVLFVMNTCVISGLTLGFDKVPLEDAAATTYYLGDQLGTTQMELGPGGWPVWQGQFTAFGQELDSQATGMRYRFTGLEHDGESGLDHATFRQYTSPIGRWMSPDPYDGSMDPSNP